MTTEIASAESNEKPKSESRLLSEGLLIAFLTVGSYAAAYFFEWGYARYFELPTSLIRVSLDMCLRASIDIILYLWILLFTGNAAAYFWSRQQGLDSTYRKKFRAWFMVMYLVNTFILLTFLTLDPIWVGVVILMAITMVAAAILTAIHTAVQRYLIRKGANLASIRFFFESLSVAFGFFGYMDTALRRRRLKLAYAIFGVVILMGLAGYGRARHTTRFLVTKAGDKVLLENYGDIYIFKSFDKATNTIGNQLTILGPDDVAKLELQRVIVKEPTILDAVEIATK